MNNEHLKVDLQLLKELLRDSRLLILEMQSDQKEIIKANCKLKKENEQLKQLLHTITNPLEVYAYSHN